MSRAIPSNDPRRRKHDADTAVPVVAPGPRGRWIGERGWQLATGTETLARYTALVSANFAELDDIIPADGNILLVFRLGKVASPALRALLAGPLPAISSTPGALHVLAVAYGGEAGPDLPELAARAGLHPADYVNQHAAAEYHVEFLGFQPGFPYLRGLPQTLQAPRRATPRIRVAAGSVAVGGCYTGIYPAPGPAGWHLIGRTDAKLFDPMREPPALLHPGDRVRFVAA